MPELRRRSAPAAASFDREHRTAMAILATERPVRRLWDRPDGRMSAWDEVLPVAAADLSRAVGASILIDHTPSHRARVGVIEAAQVVGTEVHGRLRFSGRAEVAELLDDLRELGSQISVGYAVAEWHPPDNPRADVPTFRAKSWQLLEASLVAVSADAAARIRSLQKDNPMPMDHENIISAPPVPVLPSAPVAADDGALAERNRIERLLTAGRMLGQETAAQRLITAGTPAAEGCEALVAEAERRQTAQQIVRQGESGDDPSTVIKRMEQALLHRCVPSRYELPPESVQYRGMSLVDMKRELLEAAGIHTRGWSPEQVLAQRPDRWLARDAFAMHTTSDFANLFTGVGARVLQDAYQVAASPLKAHSRQRTAGDFRTLTNLRFANTSLLERVNEAGEITAGTATDTYESFALATYAKLWNFSLQLIVNDDLGALSDWAQQMGQAAAETENALFVSLLTANNGAGPQMDEDGTFLFHVNHGNLASPGGAISTTTLADARKAMRRQRSLGSVYPIQVAPRTLLVSPDKELEAELALAQINAATTATANPFSGALRLEVEPRLSGNSWYLLSETALFEHAYLTGQAGPQVSSKEGFEVLGVQYRVVLHFGLHARDWRFAYRNPGNWRVSARSLLSRGKPPTVGMAAYK